MEYNTMNTPASNNQGYVYVLTNPAMPGLVKIGRSRTAAAGRANTMYRGDTGVPLPFEIAFECLFDDCISGEQEVHASLEQHRINPNREFFAVETSDAVVAVLASKAFEVGHHVVPVELVFDEGSLAFLAQQLNTHPFVVFGAIQEVTTSELTPIMERMGFAVPESLQSGGSIN